MKLFVREEGAAFTRLFPHECVSLFQFLIYSGRPKQSDLFRVKEFITQMYCTARDQLIDASVPIAVDKLILLIKENCTSCIGKIYDPRQHTCINIMLKDVLDKYLKEALMGIERKEVDDQAKLNHGSQFKENDELITEEELEFYHDVDILQDIELKIMNDGWSQDFERYYFFFL